MAIITGALRTRRTLRVAGGSCRGANFRAGIDFAVAAGFGVEQCLGFSLRFFEFQFFGVVFAHAAVRRRHDSCLG